MIVQSPRLALPRPASQAAPPPPPAAPDPDPVDSVGTLGKAHSHGVAVTREWNEKVGTVVGGALGLGTVIPALYAGVIGGAVGGAIAGLGFGPAAAVMQGAQGLSFLGTVFSTGGVVAKAAIVAGTACAGVGGFVAGQKLGETLGALPVATLAYPAGFAKGLFADAPAVTSAPISQKPTEVKVERPTTGLTKTAQGVLGGVGLVTGGLGGAVLGAGIGSGASLVSGLVARDLTLSSLGVAGALGAGIGAVAMAAVAGIGGYTLAGAAGKGAAWVKDKVFPDKVGQELETKRAEVKTKTEKFENLGATLSDAVKAAKASAAERQAALTSSQKEAQEFVAGIDSQIATKLKDADGVLADRQSVLDAREKDVTAQDNAIEQTINGKRAGIFADLRKPTDARYAGLHHELDGVQGKHQTREDDLSAREKHQAAVLEDRTAKLYGEKMGPVQAHYDKLDAAQTEREGSLDKWQGNIAAENKQLDSTIVSEGVTDYQRRKPALEADYAGKTERSRQEYGGKTDDLRRQHQSNLASDKNRHEDQLRHLDSTHSATMGTLAARQSNLEGSRRELESKSSSLNYEVSNAENAQRSAESELASARQRYNSELSQARSERDQAVGERNAAANELHSAESELADARSDRERYINEKATMEANLPSLRSERDRLAQQLAQMEKK